MILFGVTALSQQATLQTDGRRVLAFTHVTVIDGTGAPPKANQIVLITGDRITAVGDNMPIPREARTVDATGRFLIPGLWDAHIHTRYQGIDHLRLLIANGITSTRNMSGPWEHLPQIYSWREEIRNGERVGPRLLTAGPIIDGPGTGRAVQVAVANGDEARQIVRRIHREGADFIKVYSLLSRESYFAIADEAKQLGLPFVGHVPFSMTAAEASAAGQRSIEHLPAILLESSSQEEQIRQQLANWRPIPGERTAVGPLNTKTLTASFSIEKLNALAERLLVNQTAVVPTLSVCRNGIEGPGAHGPDRIRYIPAVYIEAWKQAALPDTVEDRRLNFEYCEKIVRSLDAAGVTILAGTDGIMAFQISGFSLQDELALLVKAGMSEMRALQAATRNPARTFNLVDQGTIESGMRADLVLLDANPVENIANTRRIRSVVAGGRLIERSELDAMLVDIEAAAKKWPGPATR
jgi:hypothetical protein